jgi:hypothetical protein
MALTIASEAVNDWTLVAQNAVSESATFTLSANYDTKVFVQGFNTSETAHIGTEYKIQVSSLSSGDEDWHDYAKFYENVGTANSEASTANPLAVGATTITMTSTTSYIVADVPAPWRAIKDATDANSELVLQNGVTTNTNITIQDGTKNQHENTAVLYSIAFARPPITIPMGAGLRGRVYVNNKYDSDGSSIAYKVTLDKTTKV